MARAELHRRRRIFMDAHRDLDEAMTIAKRDGMALHEADCHLEYARLYLALEDSAKARQSLRAARQIVERTCYHRGNRELEQIAGTLEQLN